MAQAIGYICRPAMTQRLTTLQVKSGASFKKGHFLIYNSGVDRIAATDTNLGATGNTTRIAGQAQEDSTNASGGTKGVVSVMVACPDTEWMLPLWSATPANAIADPANQIGRAFELRNVGGTYDAVNLDATTNTKCVIVDYVQESYPTWPGKITDTAGSVTAGTIQYPYAWVSFVASACALTGAGR